MTMEEAIKLLENTDHLNDAPSGYFEALDIAIESLQNLSKPNNGLQGSDLISRQDAIDAWDKLSKRGRTEFDQVLMTLPSAEPKTGWIPVSDRPPKENGKYIASLEDSVYPEASFFNGKWFMRSLNGIAREFGEYEVIAWMLMPEPYREDGEA